jgi:hypothetical protein
MTNPAAPLECRRFSIGETERRIIAALQPGWHLRFDQLKKDAKIKVLNSA